MNLHDNDAQPYDLLAIGCGPFNLGLAALSSTVRDLRFVALDTRRELRWHPGLMFEDARLQVSFLADLVSLVDPTHPLSFLAYLRDVDRLYPFFVRERFHITRREYELYLRWVLDRLSCVRLGHRVQSVRWSASRGCYVLHALRDDGESVQLQARNLVLGIGTEPSTPSFLTHLPEERVVHSSQYLTRLENVRQAASVTVVGSGQSGAEIVLDLLRQPTAKQALHWWTRNASFAPLDYSKLVLEMTTPAYVRYFHGLPEATRDTLVQDQWRHYKGVSTETLADIHERLYLRSLCEQAAPADLRCGIAVHDARCESDRLILRCRHLDTGTDFEHATDLVIAATGYRPRQPSFLQPLEAHLHRDGHGRLRIARDHSLETDGTLEGHIFVAHADLHSHGVAAPDLGMAAVRNATIVNQVLGREVYGLAERTAFTAFGVPHAAQSVQPTRQPPPVAPTADASAHAAAAGGRAPWAR